MNDGLQRAKDLLARAFLVLSHEEDCEFERFVRSNSYLPANHPAWKMAPDCHCLKTEIAKFLS